MVYLITFLEGLISFISPCMLPMIPIYLTYFAGNADKEKNILINSIAFVLGFTLLFCILGMFAGTIGGILKEYQTIINIFCGIIVIIFGLSYLEFLPINLLKNKGAKAKKVNGIFSAFIFGIVFSINLTPCVGVFLGSAIMMASVAGSALQGMSLLFVYSIGLGIPLILSAVLLKKINNVFDFIKRNYKVINNISGIFLIFIGILMTLGVMSRFMHYFV